MITTTFKDYYYYFFLFPIEKKLLLVNLVELNQINIYIYNNHLEMNTIIETNYIYKTNGKMHLHPSRGLHLDPLIL